MRFLVHEVLLRLICVKIFIDMFLILALVVITALFLQKIKKKTEEEETWVLTLADFIASCMPTMQIAFPFSHLFD